MPPLFLDVKFRIPSVANFLLRPIEILNLQLIAPLQQKQRNPSFLSLFIWTDATSCFIFCFWEQLYSHIPHLNGLFPLWTDATCLFMKVFEKSCNHKCRIWTSFSSHELLQHVYSSYPSEQNCSHKRHIWMAYFLHELTEHALSIHPCWQICGHNLHIWVA